MNLYALRCIEADLEQLVTLATVLGVIEVQDGLVCDLPGSTWDFIGYKKVGAAPLGDEPDTRPDAEDGNGNKYVHINVVTSVNVRERAEQLALENPAIAAGLAQIPRFFIVDAEGNATWPEYPMRVFA
jgi:hypothetical protein